MTPEQQNVDLLNQVEELKKNNPLLVALIKNVIAESMHVSMCMDTEHSYPNCYIKTRLSIRIDDQIVYEDYESTYLPTS